MDDKNIFERDFWILGRLVKAIEYRTVTENGEFYHIKGQFEKFSCKVVDSDRATAEKEFIKAVMQYLRGYK
jgi:hypothetical protein